jgi:hypothetical protein
MRKISRWSVAVAAVLISVTAAMPASAIDLTGTWEGKLRCTFLLDGESIDRDVAEVQLLISQSADDLNLLVFGFFRANGRVAADVSNPAKGMMSLVTCGSSSAGTGFVTGVAQAKVGLGTSDTLKGSVTTDIADLMSSCSISMKRTSTAEPGVPDCP